MTPAESAEETRVCLAVSAALTEEERARILARVYASTPQLRGCGVPDWVQMAYDRDLYLREEDDLGGFDCPDDAVSRWLLGYALVAVCSLLTAAP